MNATLIGGLFGLLVGFSGFVVLRNVADRVEREQGASGRQKAQIFRMVAIVDLVVMTLVGAFAGPLALGG